MSLNVPKLDLPVAPAAPEVIKTDTPAVPQVAPEMYQAPAVFVPTGATLSLAPAMPAVRPKAFYTVSNWHITPTDVDGVIDATNNNTNDKYSGTIADFNSMMRGN
jgi:hypothetical protein